MIDLLYFFVFVFGLTIGSFLNCLIWRLHSGQSMWNRSACPKCHEKIIWYDNVPVLSYLLRLGKCRHCGKRISLQYPIVEFLTGVLFVMAFYLNYELQIINYGSGIHDSLFIIQLFQDPILLIQLLRDLFIISVMIIVFIYDLRWYLILDIVILPSCLLVFFFNLLLGHSWQDMMISGIIGAGFFLFQFVISRGKWIGGGDVRLGLFMGLALGLNNLILAIFLGYIIGSIVSIFLLITGKKQWSSKVPLGVFLTVGCLLSLFWGKNILAWYWGLLY